MAKQIKDLPAGVPGATDVFAFDVTATGVSKKSTLANIQAGLAVDSTVVHNTGNEAVGGTKVFTSAPTLQGGANAASNIAFTSAAIGIHLKAGTNAFAGSGTLSGGTVMIANTAITAFSKVFVQNTNPVPSGTDGVLEVTILPGTGFIVNSNNVADVSVFDYFILVLDP